MPYAELDGDISYYGGMAVMSIFPKDDTLLLDNAKIGITAVNSVNKTSSIIVKFSVMHEGRIFTFPESILGFKQIHAGQTFELTKNFQTVIEKIKPIWKTIIVEFAKFKVDFMTVNAVMDNLEIKDNYLKKAITEDIKLNPNYNLWNLFIALLRTVDKKEYKTDFHKRKKIDLICSRMFHYAVVSKLINA
jgi:hypothetical protein